MTSGTRALATSRLAAAGLPLPAVLVTADDVAAGKPDPEGYLEAARRLGRPPADCLVLEDAPAGVQAALAAGMRVVGLTTTHRGRGAGGGDARRLVGRARGAATLAAGALAPSMTD